MTQVLNDPLLIVEDSDEDYNALARLMEQMAVKHPIHRCLDGDEALEFVLQTSAPQTEVSRSPRPVVILLDLNLPGTDGREVLAHLKQDQFYTDIPIVIFTTSDNPQDVDFCYQAGANGYLVKPIGFKKLEETVQAFVNYWLRANVPPRQRPGLSQFNSP